MQSNQRCLGFDFGCLVYQPQFVDTYHKLFERSYGLHNSVSSTTATVETPFA